MKRSMVAALVAGSLLGSAVGVGAVPPIDHANCVGLITRGANQFYREAYGVPGYGGRNTSQEARAVGGQGQYASTNCGRR